jgi:cyclopropane-fatty-acyl-phospholipid synthase
MNASVSASSGTGSATSAAAARTLAILHVLFGEPQTWTFAARLWDGTSVGAERPPFTFELREPFAMRAVLTPPLDLGPGRAFTNGWLDVTGDLEAAVHVLRRALAAGSKRRLPRLLGLAARLPAPPSAAERPARLAGRTHSKARDAGAIAHHYDRSKAFYAAFLDPELVYSCAYYDDGVDDLESAQRAKLDYLLRKLDLQPGETLLDIGCGWGALAVRAARAGARVTGITLSREQHAEATRRVREAGVADRVSIERCDYRDLGGRTFDKIVSVGMVEHVGRECLDAYFSRAFALLRRGGLFLNHGIAPLARGRDERATGFIARYVFPDGDLLAISHVLAAAERAGFEVRDVENLREHYTLTLRAWLANLERARDAAIAASDERTYRIYRLYLAGSAEGFASGRLAVYQSLLAKPDETGRVAPPRTRRALYC